MESRFVLQVRRRSAVIIIRIINKDNQINKIKISLGNKVKIQIKINKVSREANSNLAQEPVYLISGFYFPIKSFPFWVATAASILPLTLGLDAMRQLAFASGPSLGFLSVPLEIVILIGLTVVFLVMAQWLLKYIEKLAIREGRLTESRR